MATSTKEKNEPLNKVRVFREALEHIDRYGIRELSMRKLGKTLGVERTAVYNHIESKDDILDGVIDLIWCEIRDAADLDGDWKHVLRSLALAIRSTAKRHPDAVTLAFTKGTVPIALLQISEHLNTVLDHAGFDPCAGLAAIHQIHAFAYGFTVLDLGSFGSQPEPRPSNQTDLIRQAAMTLPEDTPPQLFERFVQMASIRLECDAEQEFAAGVERALNGLEAELTERTQRSSSQSRRKRN